MPHKFPLYQLKVTLDYITPPIWRRIVVPASISLDRLHDVLQIAMGWHDCHMHLFRAADGESYGTPFDRDDFFKDERKIKLSSLLKKEKDKMEYEYDMGDSWTHKIMLEKIIADGSAKPFTCLVAKRACPPEDCGSFPGYENFVEIMSNPKHKEYQETKEWFGGDYDPEKVSLDDINQALAKIAA